MDARRWALLALPLSVCTAVWCSVVSNDAQAATGGAQAAPGSTTTTLQWQPTLEEAQRLAAQTNRLILVHFWAPWNNESQELERRIYSLPHVQQAIHARFVPLRLNVDDFPTTAKNYGIDRIPADVIITATGQIVGRVTCPLDADAYLQQLMMNAGAAQTMAAGPRYAAAPAPTQSSPPTGVWTPMQPPAAQPPAVQTPAAQPQVASAPAAQAPVYTPPQNTSGPRYQAPPVANPSPAIVNAQMPAPQPNPPAVSAYSNDRYAEFYAKYANGQTPPPISTTNVSGPPANPSLPQVEMPATPSAAPPAYTAGPPVNTYVSPAVPVAAPGYSSPPLASAAPIAPPTAQPSPAANSVAGLDGYCPVTLMEQKRWQVGDRRWGAVHRGRVYLFTGPMEQKKFLDNPDHYSPAISGQDVVMALDYGQSVPGQRQYGVEYQSRIYLFASEASRQRFVQNGQRYAAQVLQAENPTGTVLR